MMPCGIDSDDASTNEHAKQTDQFFVLPSMKKGTVLV
jgi:hypothetical protein